ncbi:KIF1-binding protein homolog [Ceratina calcarata]|uniref:KIF-binding protein n=1 Tax=Ceratina calcarata TaxID=156304 RepID=A0AAJ7J5S1_9HYME|nr:KIF1-binding protein homolog [Ceratina calcarata]
MESSSIQDSLANVQAKFKDIRKLLNDHKKLSTENVSYKIIYQVIDLLKSMETKMIKILEDIPEEEKENGILTLAVIHLYLGMLHVDTEELKPGEEQSMKCIKLLKNKELEPAAILPVLNALNQLGIIWSQWNQLTKAKEFLIQAERIYNDFKNQLETGDDDSSKSPVINMAQILGIEEFKDNQSPRDVLEKVHTLTLYCLAQVYGSLKDHRQSALYCHMTLRRQLGENKLTQDLDYIDWALNSATLSQYFMENEGFSQARHHLAAASYILQKYENILKEKTEENGESEALTAEWENFKHRSADVARCWAKYGILLMSLSKQRLLQRSESEQDDDETDKESKLNTIGDLRFDILEKEIEPIANQITDKYLLDFDDARLVFLSVLKWLEQAKTYYTLENHASDYVLIVQDISQAYKYLSFFEEHEDRQAKMHRRRINVLEDVIKELNPQYYESACRQIWLELGETYSDILDIKLDRLRSSDEKPTAQALAKINHLAKSAIKNFQAFLNSIQMRNSNSGAEFPAEVMQSALFSYFHLGRLYNKIVSVDKTIQLENTQNSYNAYKFVVDYCDNYPSAAEVMKVELNLCRELVNLLPIKLNRLRERDN